MTILRWTSPERAARQIKRHRRVITAANFNTSIRDIHTLQDHAEWLGHIAISGTVVPSCGCPSCTAARFNMKG